MINVLNRYCLSVSGYGHTPVILIPVLLEAGAEVLQVHTYPGKFGQLSDMHSQKKKKKKKEKVEETQMINKCKKKMLSCISYW